MERSPITNLSTRMPLASGNETSPTPSEVVGYPIGDNGRMMTWRYLIREVEEK